MSVVNNTVHDGIGQGGLGDELVPVFDRDLGGYDECMFVCHVFDEVVKDELIGFLERVEPEVVQDKEVVAGNLVQFFEVGTVCFVVEQLCKEFGRRSEEYFKPLETGGVTQGGCQERFSYSGGAGDQDVFPPLNKIAGGQLQDAGPVESLALGGEVDLFDHGILTEAGLVEQVLASPVVAFFPFGLYQEGEQLVGA